MKNFSPLASLALALLAPAAASAQEVRVNLAGESIPLGAAGTTVVHSERYHILNTRYSVIRTRSAHMSSRCAVPAERVSVWSQVQGQTRWTELANEVFDRCPADNHPGVSRTVRAFMTEATAPGAAPGAELWVQLLDPRLPVAEAPMMRYRRVGERLVHQRLDTPLASAPSAPVSREIRANPSAVVDGSLAEWSAQTPLARDARGEVWVGTQGSTLHFAARTELSPQGAATLSLWVSEPGISTAVLRGTQDNPGRELRVRCDATGATGNLSASELRCRRDGHSMVIEGSTDLGTMLWHNRVVREVSVLATLRGDERRGLLSEAGMHLERASLSVPFDVAGSAPAEVLASCGGGLMGRVPPGPNAPDLGAVLTCGARCEAGRCESMVGLEGAATRLQWLASGVSSESCLNVAGPGHELFNSCRGSTQTRLVGQIEARGFDLVLAVERTRADQQVRRVEVWALVTRSAAWQRLWEGETVSLGEQPASELRMRGMHASVCRGSGPSERCEQVGALTLANEPGVVAMN